MILFLEMCQTSQIELSSGVHTYCDIGNRDCTILLLHGFAFRQGMYPLAEALLPDFRVVIPDLPFSTKPDFHVAHNLENYKKSLFELVQKLKLENVSIFGNSVGGTLGLMCCMKNPQLFDKLVVRCPLWSSKQLPAYLQIKPVLALHDHLSKNKILARKMLSLFYHLSAKMSPVEGDLVRENEPQRPIPYRDDQIDPVVLSKFLGNLVKVKIEDTQLNSIPNETLVLWGELDTFISREWGAILNQILPNSQFMSVVGEYHNIATVNPNTLAKAILKFVF
jgi:pimeloyl-ACP methyl ester carboxylesterase